ncbi:hypothetical protein D3C71_1866000 [compost metagenome]
MKLYKILNKGKVKNLIKNSYILDKKNNKIHNRKRGSELVETTLIIAISLVLIVTIFYPSIMTVFSNAINNISNWFNIAMGQIGIFT